MKNVGRFPRRREYDKIVGKLEKLDKNRGEFKGTGLANYSRYTIRSTRFGGVQLRKGFLKIASRELNRRDSDGGCRGERRLGLLVIKI